MGRESGKPVAEETPDRKTKERVPPLFKPDPRLYVDLTEGNIRKLEAGDRDAK